MTDAAAATDGVIANAPAGEVVPAAPKPEAPEKTLYTTSGARKLAFSFIFLLLLPFFVSLPPMLFWRVMQGHWTGTVGLIVLGIAFAFIMFLIFVELMQALRTRVELGPTSVKMTLPSGRGPTPLVRYRSYDIPYDQIEAVESRHEVYGGKIAPVLLQGARLVLRDGNTVKLGYVSDANMDPCFPYPVIAHQIAERAGLSVDYKGAFRRSLQKKYLGLASPLIHEPEEQVGDFEMVALNHKHERWVMRLVWLLVALVVVGIALDIIFPPSSGLPPALTSLGSLIGL